MAYFKYQDKNIYYEETGSGPPVILLHGDTASSKMFELLLPMYQSAFHVILIDFLGNGRSDRIEEFPADLWRSQGWQVVALLEHLHYDHVHLIGTSGGAWAAVNAAFERPDLISSVIADSFDGRTLAHDFAKNLLAERAMAKSDVLSMQFYEWCQGDDWESVIDSNTRALVQCADERLPLFQEPLENLAVPILFVGSRQDDMCRKDMEDEYVQMVKLVPKGRIHMFPSGGHPAMLTNAEAFFHLAEKFFAQ